MSLCPSKILAELAARRAASCAPMILPTVNAMARTPATARTSATMVAQGTSFLQFTAHPPPCTEKADLRPSSLRCQFVRRYGLGTVFALYQWRAHGSRAAESRLGDFPFPSPRVIFAVLRGFHVCQ